MWQTMYFIMQYQTNMFKALQKSTNRMYTKRNGMKGVSVSMQANIWVVSLKQDLSP